MTSDDCKALKSWISDRGFKNINQKGKDIIIEALEKQIPKKPIEGKYGHTECSACGWIVETFQGDLEKYPYCPNSGQLLDWRLEFAV